MEVSEATHRVRLTYLVGPNTELEWKAGQVIKGLGVHKQYHIELSENEEAILVDKDSDGPAGYLWELLENITAGIPQDRKYHNNEMLHIKGLNSIVILYNNFDDASTGQFLVHVDPVKQPKVYVRSDPKEYEKLESYGQF